MSNQKHRIVSFRNQRVIFTFAVFLIALAFTTAILWGHIENVLPDNNYALLAKAGLLLLPAVALIMTIWELFVDDIGAKRRHQSHPTVRRLVHWCFFGAFILIICELVHAGALLKFESSTRQQESTIKQIGDAQARIAGETTKAAMEAAGRQAQEMNARGQRRSASSAIRAGQGVAASASASAQKNVAEAASGFSPSTFLPDWYVGGGMYVALPVLAALFFAITMFFARAAQPYVDRDDNGVPDAEEEITQTEIELPK